MCVLHAAVSLWCTVVVLKCILYLFYVDSRVALVDYVELLSGLADWNLFMQSLDFPSSADSVIKQRHNNPTQQRLASLEWYQTSHPAPSWRHVADALYLMGEHDILDVLYRDVHFLKG